ncbi:hypothetical protein O77CONTIG1_04375 [Leptolyngbya sp. O-77]|nr:hypothetical protein O77CONTIG1_04375 [Leptolyngbya sp. O-77]
MKAFGTSVAKLRIHDQGASFVLEPLNSCQISRNEALSCPHIPSAKVHPNLVQT